jgi:hypothetical protein
VRFFASLCRFEGLGRKLFVAAALALPERENIRSAGRALIDGAV